MTRRTLGSRETGLQALEQIESHKHHRCVQLHTVERVSDKVVQPWGQGSRRRWRRRGYVQARKKVGDDASTELGCRLMSINLYGVTKTNLVSVANKRTGGHGSPRSGYVKVIAIDLGTPQRSIERLADAARIDCAHGVVWAALLVTFDSVLHVRRR